MKFPNFGKRNELAEELAVGTAPEPSNSELASDKHNLETGGGEKSVVHSDDENILPTPGVEAGVKKIEAVTLTWTKKELIAAYAWWATRTQFEQYLTLVHSVFLVFFVV